MIFSFFHLMLGNCSISPQTTVKLLNGVTLDESYLPHSNW